MTEGGRTLPITCKPSSKIGAPTPVGKVRPVLTIVPGGSDADPAGVSGGSSSLIDELVREGARRMLAEALQAEVEDYIARHVGERDEHGHRLVVRNGHQPCRRPPRAGRARGDVKPGASQPYPRIGRTGSFSTGQRRAPRLVSCAVDSA